MPHVPAFEIGAVFLLAALWLGLSRARDVLPDMLETVKPLAAVGALAVAAVAGYQLLPDLYHRFWPDPPAAATSEGHNSRTAVVKTSTGTPAKKATVSEVESILKVEPKPAAVAASVALTQAEPSAGVAGTPPAEHADEHTETSTETSTETATRAATPESHGGGKRIMKSIGRALHIGHRKYEPPQQP